MSQVWQKRFNSTCIRLYLVDLFIIIVLFSIYLLNQYYLKRYYDESVFLNWYLNDLIALPLLLAWLNITVPFLTRKPRPFVRFGKIMVLSLIAGFAWEFVVPLVEEKSTKSYYDIAFYFFGALLYYALIKAMSNLSE